MTIPWTCPVINGLPDASADFDERTRAQATLHDAKGAGRIHPWPRVPVTLMQAQRERWLAALRSVQVEKNLPDIPVGADPCVGPPVILEIGCHRSGVLETFASAGWAIAGVDVSRASIEEHHARHPGCFAVAPAEHLPLPDASVDRVLAIHVLEHVSDRAQALREMARVLRKGGRAFMEVPLRDPGMSWEGLAKAIDAEAWKRSAEGAGHEYGRLPVAKEFLGELMVAGLTVQRAERGWRWVGPLLDRLLQVVVKAKSSSVGAHRNAPSLDVTIDSGRAQQAAPLHPEKSVGPIRRIVGTTLRVLDIIEHRLIPGPHGGTLLVEAIKT